MNLKKIELSRIFHGGQSKILMQFYFDEKLQAYVKKIVGVKYTLTYKGWCLPDGVQVVENLHKLFDGIAYLDCTKLQITAVYNSNCKTSLNSNHVNLLGITETVTAIKELKVVFNIDEFGNQFYPVKIALMAYDAQIRIFIQFMYNQTLITKVKKF